MIRSLRQLICMLPLFVLAGCGASVSEEKPPEKAPEQTPEEKQHMDDQIKQMREMQQKQR